MDTGGCDRHGAPAGFVAATAAALDAAVAAHEAAEEAVAATTGDYSASAPVAARAVSATVSSEEPDVTAGCAAEAYPVGFPAEAPAAAPMLENPDGLRPAAATTLHFIKGEECSDDVDGGHARTLDTAQRAAALSAAARINGTAYGASKDATAVALSAHLARCASPAARTASGATSSVLLTVATAATARSGAPLTASDLPEALSALRLPAAKRFDDADVVAAGGLTSRLCSGYRPPGRPGISSVEFHLRSVRRGGCATKTRQPLSLDGTTKPPCRVRPATDAAMAEAAAASAAATAATAAATAAVAAARAATAAAVSVDFDAALAAHGGARRDSRVAAQHVVLAKQAVWLTSASRADGAPAAAAVRGGARHFVAAASASLAECQEVAAATLRRVSALRYLLDDAEEAAWVAAAAAGVLVDTPCPVSWSIFTPTDSWVSVPTCVTCTATGTDCPHPPYIFCSSKVREHVEAVQAIADWMATGVEPVDVAAAEAVVASKTRAAAAVARYEAKRSGPCLRHSVDAAATSRKAVEVAIRVSWADRRVRASRVARAHRRASASGMGADRGIGVSRAPVGDPPRTPPSTAHGGAAVASAMASAGDGDEPDVAAYEAATTWLTSVLRRAAAAAACDRRSAEDGADDAAVDGALRVARDAAVAATERVMAPPHGGVVPVAAPDATPTEWLAALTRTRPPPAARARQTRGPPPPPPPTRGRSTPSPAGGSPPHRSAAQLTAAGDAAAAPYAMARAWAHAALAAVAAAARPAGGGGAAADARRGAPAGGAVAAALRAEAGVAVAWWRRAAAAVGRAAAAAAAPADGGAAARAGAGAGRARAGADARVA